MNQLKCLTKGYFSVCCPLQFREAKERENTEMVLPTVLEDEKPAVGRQGSVVKDKENNKIVTSLFEAMAENDRTKVSLLVGLNGTERQLLN